MLEFFQKTPVTCLTVVISKGTEQSDIFKRVITILSSILTHNGSFTLMAVRRMFQNDILQDVDVVHWWSD
ncbi:MAG: hypothetical protein EZS28_056037, partial [Streblomastix strix]